MSAKPKPLNMLRGLDKALKLAKRLRQPHYCWLSREGEIKVGNTLPDDFQWTYKFDKNGTKSFFKPQPKPPEIRYVR